MATSFTPDDPATIEAAQLASYSTRFTGKDVGTESFLGKLARAESAGLWSFQKLLQRISLDNVPNSRMTRDRLEDWATTLGLSDGAGGYGPLAATAATGIQATATGTPGSSIPNHTALMAVDGVTELEVTPAATIGGGGTATVYVNAVTPGTAGNAAVGATLNFVSPPSGVGASVTVTVGATNGTDDESDADLLARIFDRLRNPPRGGSQADWDVWCALALTSLDRVYGYARRHGTGTVDEVVTYAVNAAGTGTSRQVVAGDLTIIEAYLDAVRPVAVEGRNVLTPYMPSGSELTIRTRIVPYTAGLFDWSSNTMGITVLGYSAGTGVGGRDQIYLSGAMPADFTAAVTLGSLPRIVVVSTGTGAPIVPLQIQAFKAVFDSVNTWVDFTTPTGWVVPNINDKAYSGGPAHPLIAAAQLAYVNSLGPSRSGGFADPNDHWNDLVEGEQLARIALETVDANGDALAKNIVKVAGVPQVTIAVGSGAPTTNDYQPADDYTHAPECAQAAYVVVTD